jgi:hypothetical protein
VEAVSPAIDDRWALQVVGEQKRKGNGKGSGMRIDCLSLGFMEGKGSGESGQARQGLRRRAGSKQRRRGRRGIEGESNRWDRHVSGCRKKEKGRRVGVPLRGKEHEPVGRLG